MAMVRLMSSGTVRGLMVQRRRTVRPRSTVLADGGVARPAVSSGSGPRVRRVVGVRRSEGDDAELAPP